jgi:hypothetical protein
MPRVVLWAWERPEDLRFLDPHRFGVAFLAQTLTLKNNEVIFNPRRQPLRVAPETKLIAVTRIESQKITRKRVSLSDAQRQKLVALILRSLELENVAGIQIDFDVVASERNFYSTLLEDLRQRLPDHVPLSMTALASFCVGDRWLQDLPVDEAIPMVFRMGPDSRGIKNQLAAGDDFRAGICRRSYGIAVDEPLESHFRDARRVYAFNANPWNAAEVEALEERIKQ